MLKAPGLESIKKSNELNISLVEARDNDQTGIVNVEFMVGSKIIILQ
jgi:hypothetical protein